MDAESFKLFILWIFDSFGYEALIGFGDLGDMELLRD
jgi:hypothetical protein